MTRLWTKPPRSFGAVIGLAVSVAVAAPGAAVAQNKNVTIVLLEELANFDLCNAMLSTTGRVLRQNVGEALTRIDPKDGSIQPLLATSWEQVDPKTWRFKLRQGVTFHDGTPFTADAVVKTIERTFGNESLTCENRAKSGLNRNTSAKAVDGHTVEVSLDTPAPILPVQMGTITISHPKSPTDKLLTTPPLGTGPYKFTGFNSGVDITLERYDGYWGPKPVVEKARYIFRKESSVRASMVTIGEADLAPQIAVQDATDPATDYSFLNSETTRLRIDAVKPPLNDKRVRMALNLAVDREAMRGSVFSKDVLYSTQMVVPNVSGHNHDIDKKLWKYDPEKAKKLIAEARADGVPVDTQIEIICRIGQWPGAEEGMEAILGYLLAVGFNAKLRCMEQNLHYQMTNKPFAEDRGSLLLQDQHDNNNGDAVFTVYTKYGCEGRQSTMCSKTVDELAAKAAALPIGPERVKTWQEIFRIVYEDEIGDIPLFHMVGYARVGKRINYIPSIATNTEVELATITFK